jgi:ABC-type maltose transport system permease subunit
MGFCCGIWLSVIAIYDLPIDDPMINETIIMSFISVFVVFALNYIVLSAFDSPRKTHRSKANDEE